MRRHANPLLALGLLVTLTASVPVPRVIPVDPGSCGAMCRAETTCSPCPGSSPCAPPGSAATEDDPCPDSRRMTCETCVRCLCGVGVLAPEVRVAGPAAVPSDDVPPARPLPSLVREPASPPPKSA